ncbi:DEAD/DEAH box helicase domain protein [Nitzschia inconspicua]|uniref:DEAD/DEAH box helicase domain protein n=1 Tax=Nitzschia inconspicua TaxID=303405 RepID=A0A9K3LMT1_9STRA|nr:DEAD/DEAH box helicase domain protein [Nitzschia inconspicua]
MVVLKKRFVPIILLVTISVAAVSMESTSAFTQSTIPLHPTSHRNSVTILKVSRDVSKYRPTSRRPQEQRGGNDRNNKYNSNNNNDRNTRNEGDDTNWFSEDDKNYSENPTRGRSSQSPRMGQNRKHSAGRRFSNDKDSNRRPRPGDASNIDRSAFRSMTKEPSSKLLIEEEITDTNAHFFSQKSLQDPTFVYNDNDNDNNIAQDNTLHQRLCTASGITRPSRIQAMAWPKILTGKHCIIGEQTGSGKSLAYLLPLLQKALSSPPNPENGQPKILVLAPTAELADQLRSVCAKISQAVPFNTMVVTATGKFTTTIRDQIRMIQRQPIDILISTPGRVSTILRTRNSGLDLSKLQAVVLDEVDILMIDDTFGSQLRTVGEAAPVLDKTQFVFVTATLPDSIVETIEKEFPGVEKIKGPGLHRVAPSLKENLVDVSVPAEHNRNEELCFDIKAKQLLKALRQNRCRRTLVFCNTVESCRSVENLLNRKDRRGRVYEVLAYHNAMTPEARNTNLQVFGNGRKGVDGNEDDVDYVLICTDRAARGVDFDASAVDHVVIFDFPKDPAEYIRRVGRTARAGRSGTSTVFAYGWQMPIARSVMGKKLESFSIASVDKDSDEDYEFRNDRRTKKNKQSLIKEKIESGRLWDE